MPLDGSGTATKPSGTTAAPNTTIESAKYNSLADDIYSILNTARPITKGGTGATSASAARTALGLAIGTDVQAYSADISNLVTAWTPASASGPASLEFAEDTDNGVHKITVKAPASLAADQTITWPDITDTLVGLAATQTLTNKTLTTPTITLKQSATPTPTAEGDIQWDTDDNVIVVGDGAATKIFVALPSGAAAGDMLYLSAAKVLSRVPVGTVGQLWTVNAGATAPEWAAAPASGQPVPTTSAFPVGTLLFARSTSGSVADGATVAGSALKVAVTDGTGSFLTTGAAQSGTWKNVTGVSVAINSQGYFVRTV